MIVVPLFCFVSVIHISVDFHEKVLRCNFTWLSKLVLSPFFRTNLTGAPGTDCFLQCSEEQIIA